MKKLFTLLTLVFVFSIQAQIIKTFAGTALATQSYSGDGGPAISARLAAPQSMACDAAGNLYFSDYNNHRIRKINTSGIITTIAGTGVAGYTGDGSLAINAKVNTPTALAMDKMGNLYLADVCLSSSSIGYIRKINTLGIISTIAGDTSSVAAYASGTPALSMSIENVNSISFDYSGNLYYAEPLDVVKIDLSGITTIMAGSGNQYMCPPGGNGISADGDGGNALQANFSGIKGLAVDSKNNIYIGERISGIIRKVDAVTGIISYYAGTGCGGSTPYGANNGLASTATFDSQIHDLKIDSLNNLYVCDWDHVYKIDTLRMLSRIAGVTPAYAIAANDSGPALASDISTDFIAIDKYNHIYTSSGSDNVIRKITMCNSTVPVINIHAIGSTSVCSGANIKLVANGAPNFVWQPWAASLIDTLVAAPTSSIQYTAMGYYSNGCVGQSTFSISVLYPSPTTSFVLQADPTPHVWDAYPTYSGGTPPYTYSWNWGDGSPSSTSAYPSHTYSVAGLYNLCTALTDANGCFSTYCQNDSVYKTNSTMIQINVLANNPTNIQVYGQYLDFKIYPNPNTGSFVIEPISVTKQTMQVYDVNGKLVLSQTINGKTNIDASILNEGVYNISLMSDEGVINKRLVIVR